MKTIITYGTYDVLHKGHISLLRRAKEMGDVLIVGLSSDSFNTMKHKSALLNYQNRKIVLEAIRYVDRVVPETSWEQKIQDIKDYNVDIFVIGDDWEGHFDFLKPYCDVVYLPRTKGTSSTQIRAEITSGD